MGRVNQVNQTTDIYSYRQGDCFKAPDSIGVDKRRLLNLINPARPTTLQPIFSGRHAAANAPQRRMLHSQSSRATTPQTKIGCRGPMEAGSPARAIDRDSSAATENFSIRAYLHGLERPSRT